MPPKKVEKKLNHVHRLPPGECLLRCLVEAYGVEKRGLPKQQEDIAPVFTSTEDAVQVPIKPAEQHQQQVPIKKEEKERSLTFDGF